MFFLFILFFLGSSYLFYRYRSVSNKKIFFNSPIFICLTGSISILIISALFVGAFAPDGIVYSSVSDERNTQDTLSKTDIDTSRYFLLHQSSLYHYERVHLTKESHLYDSYQSTLRLRYEQFANSSVDSIASLGNFGLGVFAMLDDHMDRARFFFDKVKMDHLPGLHYCLAEIQFGQGSKETAIKDYLLEFHLNNDFRVPALKKLLTIYQENKNYEGLYVLYHENTAKEYFSNSLARLTLLYALDLRAYFGQVIGLVAAKANLVGFCAALFISIVWMAYLFRLNLYDKSRILSLLGMFAGGSTFIFLVLLSYDAVDLYTKWRIDGGIINDLLYCIFVIGIPEEFVKILPFVFVLIFSQKMAEPIDYIIYASSAALGFAFIENITYFEEIDGGIIHGRAYLSVIGHMIDSSIVAYAYVIGNFKRKDTKSLRFLLPLGFIGAATVHGLYDFLLFHHWIFIFFIYFVFIVQLWIIMINNCLNNSARFSYKLAIRAENSRVFLALALTSVFAMEFIATGFSFSKQIAYSQLVSNASFAGFLIIFFSSNLSSFDLIKGYWRKVSFREQEKRGYGSRDQRTAFTSWYFVNAIQSHNYVGLKVVIYNDPYNKLLSEILDGDYGGQIVNRIILYDKDESDPNWFLIKMDKPLPFATDRPDYILVKLRFQEDSLLYEDEVQVYFKSIVDARELYKPKPDKAEFPFYGWAYLKLES